VIAVNYRPLSQNEQNKSIRDLARRAIRLRFIAFIVEM